MAGLRGEITSLGYKAHYSLDWISELPVAYMVRPANENEKRYFKLLALKAGERLPNAEGHVADSQYSSKRLRRLVRGSWRATLSQLRGDEGIRRRLPRGQAIQVPWKP